MDTPRTAACAVSSAEEAPTRRSPQPALLGHDRDGRRAAAKAAAALASSRSDRVGLAANVVLLLGYSLALWFQAYEFAGRDRELVAIGLYFCAFAILILSGVMELVVDTFSVRTTGHGRYHADNAGWNIAISYLFILAGGLDVAAFIFWMRRDLETEDAVLLISSYVLLVMAILALYFQVQEIMKMSPEMTLMDKIDLAANLLVFSISVVGVALRHMEFSHKDFGDATNRMELATVPIWLFSSVLYVSTDVLRLQRGGG